MLIAGTGSSALALLTCFYDAIAADPSGPGLATTTDVAYLAHRAVVVAFAILARLHRAIAAVRIGGTATVGAGPPLRTGDAGFTLLRALFGTIAAVRNGGGNGCMG